MLLRVTNPGRSTRAMSGVGAGGAFDVQTRSPQGLRGGHRDGLVFAAKQRAFRGMRVDAEEADARARYAQQLAGAHAGRHRLEHKVRAHAVERVAHAFVQRDVQDAQAATDEQQKHVVFRHATHPRHQRRVAAERDARLVDGGFVVRAGFDGVKRTRAAGLQRRRG